MENHANSLHNLPPIVIRTLVDHGPIDVTTLGNGQTARVPCAPFEDVLHLFVTAGSTMERGLLLDPRIHVVAKAPDGAYALRMTGRGHAGVPLNRHHERASLQAWSPEGVVYQRTLVVPFVAEEIEFVQGLGDDAVRHTGRTPIGLTRGTLGQDLFRAAFSGLAGPLAAWSLASITVWLGAQGAEYPGRGLAVGLSLTAAVTLIGSTRLLAVAKGFKKWRAGMGRDRDAPILREGLLAPIQVQRYAAVGLSASAVCLGTMGTMWGSQLVMTVVGLTGIWIVGPAWWFHLMSPTTEAVR